MNRFSFVTQIGMIAAAIAIVILYIKPQITTIRETQDLTSSYEQETENVSQVNESLKSKVAAIEAIAPQDAQALARFVPDTIDEITVLKDLSTILQMQAIDNYDVKYQGSNAGSSDNDDETEGQAKVTEHYFSVSFETTYEQLKSLLSQIETNNYLLEVANLKLSDSTDNNLKVDMSLTTYSRLLATPEVN